MAASKKRSSKKTNASKKRTSRRKSTRKKSAVRKKDPLSLGVTHKRVSYKGVSCHETAFERSDLIFSGVSHGELSYEVRIFLNNRKVNIETPRSIELGYAGRFVIFGHGGCFGDANHCNYTSMSDMVVAPHVQHPLARKTIHVTITRALKHVLDTNADGLKTISMVTVKKTPRRKECGPAEDLFRFNGVSLNLYG